MEDGVGDRRSEVPSSMKPAGLSALGLDHVQWYRNTMGTVSVPAYAAYSDTPQVAEKFVSGTRKKLSC